MNRLIYEQMNCLDHYTTQGFIYSCLDVKGRGKKTRFDSAFLSKKLEGRSGYRNHRYLCVCVRGGGGLKHFSSFY